MITEKGSNRPCKGFPRLEDTNYLSSAARATRAAGACLIADCGLPATQDELCVRHDALYRLRCECGRILTDAGVERNACSACYSRSTVRKARKQKNTNRAKREARARRNK